MNLAELDVILHELQSENAENFAVARFALITSLRQRLGCSKHENNRVLFEKLQTNLINYQRDLKECRASAVNVVNNIADDFPEHGDAAKHLFEECKFRQLMQLSLKLIEGRAGLENLNALSLLKSQMNSRLSDNQGVRKTLSFDEILSQQELAIRDESGCNLPAKVDGSGEQLELQSMKFFRESMKYFNIDQIIEKAINDSPENPGPHNPKMLAIKSLIHMRDLSPQYLRRFTGYIETILWLEKNSSRLSKG